MKRLKLSHMCLLTSLSMSSAYALQCPDKNSAPLCPDSGTTLLDETYPTQAFVISNAPMVVTKESSKVTQNFIKKVITSYDYKNIPQVIVPMQNKEDFKALTDNIRKSLKRKKVSDTDIASIMEQITLGPAHSYTWQQDWFESFVDLKTGTPLIRQAESYVNRVPVGHSRELAANGLQCSLNEGETLKSAYPLDPYMPVSDVIRNELSFGSSEMGGNIEGAPGGFCMVGDNQGKAFTQQFCGNESNVIKLQTSWLSVGHVDEIFKIIPTQYNDGRPKECEFSLMAASPKKALELMSDSKRGQTPFYNFDDNNEEIDTKEMRGSRANISQAGNYEICSYLKSAVDASQSKKDNRQIIKNRSVFLKLFFGENAFAIDKPAWLTPYGVTSPNMETAAKMMEECTKNLDQVSNYDMQKMMKSDEDFNILNLAVNDSIEKDKKLIKTKILKRLPQCAKYYNEIDAPNLFYGSKPILKADGTYELKKPGTVDSFLPNPTNSVLMNKTVVFPDSGNKLFNGYVTDELKKRNMKSDFIDSWDYAHIGHGNIHCSSHSIPHCKPKR